ncbi:hypothetical protein JT359_13040 [Candidatus Poribacteria bacterium]|nr:hypothetical protein [Candidatus Poribacteria bacterium]
MTHISKWSILMIFIIILTTTTFINAHHQTGESEHINNDGTGWKAKWDSNSTHTAFATVYVAERIIHRSIFSNVRKTESAYFSVPQNSSNNEINTGAYWLIIANPDVDRIIDRYTGRTSNQLREEFNCWTSKPAVAKSRASVLVRPDDDAEVDIEVNM